MHHLTDALNVLFGGNSPGESLDAAQMAGRALLVYVAGLAIVRAGKNRLLGRSTAFDIVLGFILGSMLSRAINGSAPLIGTLVAAVVLVALHWTFARLAMSSDNVASAVKGRRLVLVRDGRIERAALHAADLSERDLREELRLGAHIDDPAEVDLACLERNGRISVLPRRRTEG
jgi:uncharacterized membrane protein YcaP (DUF421 family)